MRTEGLKGALSPRLVAISIAVLLLAMTLALTGSSSGTHDATVSMVPVNSKALENIGYTLTVANASGDNSEWWNENWPKRRPITISGSHPENYQLYIEVPYDNDMQSDYNDLRFLENENMGELNYWIENYTTDNAKVWVRRLEKSDNIIYVYYGNPIAPSASDGDATFPLFEDFEGENISSLQLKGWKKVYNTDTSQVPAPTYEIVNGQLRLSNDYVYGHGVAFIYCGENFENSWFELDVKLSSGGTPYYRLLVLLRSSYDGETTFPRNYYTFSPISGEGEWQHRKAVNDTTMVLSSGSPPFSKDVWYKYTYAAAGTRLRGYVNGSLITENLDSSHTSGYVSISQYESTSYYDNLIVRRYSLPEPMTSVGGEEIAPPKWGLIESWTGTVRAPFARVRIYPSDDSYMRSDYPNSNYGDVEFLYVAGNPAKRSFLKFPLIDIPSGAIIKNAYLKLYAQDTSGEPNVQARRVDNDNWNETTITWDSQPPYDNVLDVENVETAGAWYSWTVTSFVSSQLVWDQVASFCLRVENENASYSALFRSKEYDSYDPYLEVTYALSWTGSAVFSLVNLYTVNVEKILDLYAGSKLVVKFYTYGNEFEDENVVETFIPPVYVEENESARHPEGIGVKKAALVLIHDDTEDLLENREKYGGNPVLEYAPENDFESWGVRRPTVFWDEEDEIWKMWYTSMRGGSDNYIQSISYATSTDGRNWSKYENNPVFENNINNDWENTQVAFPVVMKFENVDGDTDNYYMWYLGYASDYMGNDGGKRYVGFAYSTDGINWTRGDNNPIITPSTPGWSDYSNETYGSFEFAVVRKSPDNWMIYLSTGVKPNDKLGQVWGTSSQPNDNNWAIGGIVYNPDDAPAWADTEWGNAPDILTENHNVTPTYQNEKYYQVHSGWGGGETKMCLGIASSTDLINWTDWDENPYIEGSSGWDSNTTHFSTIYWKDDVAWLYYSACPEPPAPEWAERWKIGLYRDYEFLAHFAENKRTSGVISTIASFTVTKTILEVRFAKIPLEWALASPAERVALEIEFAQIPLYWALAPS